MAVENFLTRIKTAFIVNNLNPLDRSISESTLEEARTLLEMYGFIYKKCFYEHLLDKDSKDVFYEIRKDSVITFSWGELQIHLTSALKTWDSKLLTNEMNSILFLKLFENYSKRYINESIVIKPFVENIHLEEIQNNNIVGVEFSSDAIIILRAYLPLKKTDEKIEQTLGTLGTLGTLETLETFNSQIEKSRSYQLIWNNLDSFFMNGINNKKIKYIHKKDIVGLKNIVFLLSQKRSNAEKYKALPLTIKTFLSIFQKKTLITYQRRTQIL